MFKTIYTFIHAAASRTPVVGAMLRQREQHELQIRNTKTYYYAERKPGQTTAVAPSIPGQKK